MSRKALNGLIVILVVGLFVVLLSSDRGISGVMEDCGSMISRALGG
jgi:hypothetical protein